MPQLDFYDIPVYRLPEAQYYVERQEFIEKYTKPSDGSPNSEVVRSFYERNPDERSHMEGHLARSYGGAWTYNEIIGYIRLYFLGSQVRGEYWRVDKQKIVRTRKKQFEFQSFKVVYEEDIPQPFTNKEIFRAILAYLERAKKEPKMRSRFINTSLFEKLGEHVDWLGLIRQHGTYGKPPGSH